MILFKSKYRRRIEIAKLKATIKLREIEKEYLSCELKNLEYCEERLNYIKRIISVFDALLKGKEVKF